MFRNAKSNVVDGVSPLNLRVWTTPVELEQEKFVIFAVQDISFEKENARLLEQVQKLAIMDPLTEIYNEEYFLMSPIVKLFAPFVIIIRFRS